jgi:cytochrome b6-f complex iron-sulfur subunit
VISRRRLLAACPALACVACEGHGPANPQTTSATDTPVTGIDTGESTTDPAPCLVAPGTAAEGWFPLSLADFPELTAVGGFVYVSPDTRRIIVARVADDCYAALDQACTHAGATIRFSYGRFVCPLHGSAFARDGTVLGGPAPSPLATYPVGLADDVLWIGPAAV